MPTGPIGPKSSNNYPIGPTGPIGSVGPTGYIRPSISIPSGPIGPTGPQGVTGMYWNESESLEEMKELPFGGFLQCVKASNEFGISYKLEKKKDYYETKFVAKYDGVGFVFPYYGSDNKGNRFDDPFFTRRDFRSPENYLNVVHHDNLYSKLLCYCSIDAHIRGNHQNDGVLDMYNLHKNNQFWEEFIEESKRIFTVAMVHLV